MFDCCAYYYTQQFRKHLPLLSTSLHTTIRATASHTCLSQIFTNQTKEDIPTCTYQFPLYDGISIVKFTCTVGQKKLKGVVREKSAAKEIFDDATRRGETAGLLEQHEKASDVFSTSLGNISAGEKVIVEIEYVGELKMEGGDEIKLSIPMKVAPRYGNSGATFDSAACTEEGLKITVDVEMWEGMQIDGVVSLSHPVAILIGKLSTAVGGRGENKASVTLSQDHATLKKDFVLLTTVKGLGNPKAMLETHSSIPNQRALMVSLVPKFVLPAHHPEIVFVADRSGSMANSVGMLISAMKVFLKSLPIGVQFNICSFGTGHELLWAKSRPYSKEALAESMRYIQTFQANLGGTETWAALSASIKNRYPDLPLEIILLTDGDIWQQSSFFSNLNNEVEKSKGAIRVFPLGIGNSVSHAFINGVARAGNGFPQNVQRDERLEGSVVRMLRGALSPYITDYTMEVHYESDDDDFELVDKITNDMENLLFDTEPKSPRVLPTISLFDPAINETDDIVTDNAPPMPQVPHPKIIQSPSKIPSLFAGANTLVYLLLSPETIQRNPKNVFLRGSSSGQPVALSIPIEIISTRADTIHQLAARKATQDLEEGRGWLRDSKGKDGIYLKEKLASQFENIVEREAIRLGEQFQVANKWCSFVAVSSNNAAQSDFTGTADHNESFTRSNAFTPYNNSNVDYNSGSSLFGGSRAPPTQMQQLRRRSGLPLSSSGSSQSLFGLPMKTSQPQNLFSQPKTAQSQSLFGQPKTAQGNPFGFESRPPQPQASRWLFGQSAPPPPPVPGSGYAPSQSFNPFDSPHLHAKSCSMFGNNANALDSPRLFGSASGGHQTILPAQSTSLPSPMFGGIQSRSLNMMSGSTDRPSDVVVDFDYASPVSDTPSESSYPCFEDDAPFKQYNRPLHSTPARERGLRFPIVEDMSSSSFESSGFGWNAKPDHEKVLGLIDNQDFEGSWTQEDVAPILGFQIPKSTSKEDKVTRGWVTMIVVCFLEQKMASERATWELVVAKARAWLGGILAEDFERVEKEATEIVLNDNSLMLL